MRNHFWSTPYLQGLLLSIASVLLTLAAAEIVFRFMSLGTKPYKVTVPTVRGYMQLASLGVKREDGFGEPPRLSVAEAMDQAEAMVERCHRLYLRTLGALQGLRRRPPVVVRRAGQVNIAGQQVNLAR